MVKVRFAPSPTGNLHIGSVRTALFNWLFARKHNGKYILRIEDTDLQRSTVQYEENILEGLKWLGLDYDFGPEKESDGVKYRQTERIAEHLYDQYVQQLINQGDAYFCYCSIGELEKEREAGCLTGYSGKCRNLTQEQKAILDAENKSKVVRFKIKPEQLIVKDIIRGDVEFDTSLISDLVIQKADGTPAYNFAVVVDDITMEITHVIRGEDHLPNTPKQIQIYRALGAKLPQFAHLPMILGPDKSKLSKRHGATSVIEYQSQGYLPQALINYLSLLGWSHPEGKEKMPVEEIIDNFHIERISKSGAVFDVEKLKWLNGLYLRAMPLDELIRTVYPWIEKIYPDKLAKANLTWLENVIESSRDHLTLISDIIPTCMVFFEDQLVIDPEIVNKYLSDELSCNILTDIINTFKQDINYTEDYILEYINSLPVKFSCGKGKVLKPIRIAVTGQEHGLALVKVLFLLGKDVVIARIGGMLNV